MSIAQLTNSTAKLQGFSAILTRKSPKNRRLKLKKDCRPASVSPPYLHDYFMSFSVHLCAPFSNVLKSKQRFDITCSGLSYLRAYNERALFSRGSSLIYFISLCRRYLRHICKVTHTHKLSKERLQLIISVVCPWYPRLIIFSQIVKVILVYYFPLLHVHTSPYKK